MNERQRFAIGEEAWLLPTSGWPQPMSLCTVIGSLRLFRFGYGPDNSFDLWGALTELRYEVVDEAGDSWFVSPDLLRKRRQPPEQTQLGKWDECPWQPAKERETPGHA